MQPVVKLETRIYIYIDLMCSIVYDISFCLISGQFSNGPIQGCYLFLYFYNYNILYLLSCTCSATITSNGRTQNDVHKYISLYPERPRKRKYVGIRRITKRKIKQK